LNIDCARHAVLLSCPRQSKPARLGIVCAITLACALALAGSPAAAKVKSHSKLNHKVTEDLNKQSFGKIPKGPLQIMVSIDQQKLHLYSDGTQVAETLVATGVPDHPTPTGVFSLIEKSREHRSNIYSSAPMPYMQRITWSGVAIHEGVGVGHPASHGCIRMPHEFATRLWALTRLGTPVIIARPELTPQEFADPHLFIHKEKPTTPSSIGSTSAAIEPIRTAQTVDGSKTTDAPSGQKDDTHGGSAALAGPVNAQKVASAAVAGEALETDKSFRTERVVAASGATVVTLPGSPPKPAEIAPAATGAAIAVFVSRKNKRIYVRQHFSPLFDAPIAIDHPEQPLGTHVFTAMEYLDGSSLRWNVVSLPGEQTSRNMESGKKNIRGAPRRDRALEPLPDLPPQTPRQALARIEIPQNVIDQISQLIVPGSSLMVSDQGLGEETGEGTSFIVVTH
jgi:hypothetical protein